MFLQKSRITALNWSWCHLRRRDPDISSGLKPSKLGFSISGVTPKSVGLFGATLRDFQTDLPRPKKHYSGYYRYLPGTSWIFMDGACMFQTSMGASFHCSCFDFLTFGALSHRLPLPLSSSSSSSSWSWALSCHQSNSKGDDPLSCNKFEFIYMWYSQYYQTYTSDIIGWWSHRAISWNWGCEPRLGFPPRHKWNGWTRKSCAAPQGSEKSHGSDMIRVLSIPQEIRNRALLPWIYMNL